MHMPRVYAGLLRHLDRHGHANSDPNPIPIPIPNSDPNQVSSATSTVMVMFMSSANMGQFIVLGMLDLEYAVVNIV